MSGLFSAVMIGLGRAVGETMVVLMAAGNTQGEAMQLIAAVARNEMQSMMSMGRAFDNARYAKLLAKLPQLD